MTYLKFSLKIDSKERSSSPKQLIDCCNLVCTFTRPIYVSLFSFILYSSSRFLSKNRFVVGGTRLSSQPGYYIFWSWTFWGGARGPRGRGETQNTLPKPLKYIFRKSQKGEMPLFRKQMRNLHFSWQRALLAPPPLVIGLIK